MNARTALAALLGSALGATTPVLSAVLIQVDVSDPTAVTFTATGNASQVNDSSATLYDGVDLLHFFTIPVAAGTFTFTGNLTPSGGLAYSGAMSDSYPSAADAVNLYYGGPFQSNSQTFSVAAPAFTGTGVLVLSRYGSLLPTAGTSGDIIAGYSGGGSHAVIGQWAVVPEPSMLLLAGGAAAMFLLRRRN